MIVNFKKQHRPVSLFKTDRKVFVRYRMDGCRYCVESQGEWDALMTKIKRKYTVPGDMDIVEVNSNVATKLGLKGEHVPTGYPSYAIVENGGKTVKKLEPPISAFEGVMRTNGIIKGRTTRRNRTRRRRRVAR
jgi:hypothetical protein